MISNIKLSNIPNLKKKKKNILFRMYILLCIGKLYERHLISSFIHSFVSENIIFSYSIHKLSRTALSWTPRCRFSLWKRRWNVVELCRQLSYKILLHCTYKCVHKACPWRIQTLNCNPLRNTVHKIAFILFYIFQLQFSISIPIRIQYSCVSTRSTE